MSDNLDLSVILKIAAQGGAKTSQEVVTLQDAVDDLRRSEELAQSTVDELTRGLSRQSKALEGTALTANEAAKAEQRLLKIQRERAKVDASYSNKGMNAQSAAQVKEQAAKEKLIQLEAKQQEASEKTAEITERNAQRKADAEAKAAQQVADDWETAWKRLEARQAKDLQDDTAESHRQRQAGTDAIRAQEEALKKNSEAGYENVESINAQRYALYEVAAAYGAVSLGLFKVGKETIGSFTEMESGFSKVERTSGETGVGLKELETDLLQLARAIPVTTEELQDLAARGAQMGIASKDVADFAEVMAKFIATSPEVDVNSIAESFGRLSSLTGEGDFLAMASAIAQVGVNSAATDAQIIKTTEGVARATAAFGFSAQEIIGLSAAMASLGVQPEAARGIMVQFVNTVDRGAAGITDAMQVMAAQMGVAEEAATALWKTNPTQFIAELSKALTASEDLTLTLDEMGLVGQRLRPFFAALTNDFKNNADINTVLSKALADANQGFEERIELERQFAPIADDLNSKLVQLSNAWSEIAYSVGIELAPALVGIVTSFTEVINSISDFVQSPVGGFLSKMAFSVGAVVAVYAGLRSAIALATAGLSAFITAMGGVSAITGGLSGSIRLLGTRMQQLTGATAGAGSAMYFLRGALKAVGRALIAGAVFHAITEAIFNTGETAVWVGNKIVWLTEVLVDFATSVSSVFGVAAAIGLKNVHALGTGLSEWGQGLVDAEAKTESFTDTMGAVPPAFDDFEDGAYDAAEGADALGSSLDDVEEKLVSVTDYANELKGVLDRAFELDFSLEEAEDRTQSAIYAIEDQITKGKDGIQKQIDEIEKNVETAGKEATKAFKEVEKQFDNLEKARDKVASLRTEIRGLQADLGLVTADLSKKKYWLSVAIKMGDSQRAEQLQAEIAKGESDRTGIIEKLDKKQKELLTTEEKVLLGLVNLKDAQKDLAKAEKEVNRTRGIADKQVPILTRKMNDYTLELEGSSREAIENRKLMRNLNGSINDQVVAFANLGNSQSDILDYSVKLTDRWGKEVKQLGLTGKAVTRYKNNLKGIKTIVDKVPRNVSTALEIKGLKASRAALKEWRVKVREELKKVRTSSKTTDKALSGIGSGLKDMNVDITAQLYPPFPYKDWDSYLDALFSLRTNKTASNLSVKPKLPIKAEGGYTGPGGKYEPAAIVHKGEYVIPKRDVNQSTGLPYADAMGKLVQGTPVRNSYANGGFVNPSGGGPVDLSARSIQLLASAIDPRIFLDGNQLANSVTKSFVRSSNEGSN